MKEKFVTLNAVYIRKEEVSQINLNSFFKQLQNKNQSETKESRRKKIMKITEITEIENQ